MPEGCSKTFQISFIENEALRPDKEHCWLVQTKRENGWESTTCRRSIADALDFATREIGVIPKDWVPQAYAQII